MRVVVSVEERFDRTSNGAVWTRGPFAHRFWTRYLDAFEEVGVVARVRDVREPAPGAKRADGPGVTFAAVPCYIGLREYLARLRDVRRAARGAVKVGEAVILRVASPIAVCIEAALRREGYPYALEVVGDPHEVFGPGAVRHPLRPFFRWQFSRQLRRQCARACAVGYVTERALQRRYPPAPEAFATHYSDADMPESAFAPAPRARHRGQGPFAILTVGTMAQLYKAQDVLLDAVAACAGAGVDIEVRLVGDGKHRVELESRAARLDLGERARFLGELPAGEAVRSQMDRSDLFVLASRSEGLPKAMIEAMARGLPCIGSSAGGIPELLAPEDLVPPGDPKALAAKIRAVMADPDRRARMSARNLMRARGYREAVLGERRRAFYRQVRASTERWLRAGLPR